MTKKIAILTQPLITNFGGTLQAYALQKKLKDKGYEVETINFQYREMSCINKVLSTLKNLFIRGKKVIHFTVKEKNIIKSKHTSFIQKNIKYSREFKDKLDLKKYFETEKFDAVIVGSDQVWRVAYSPNIELFFLDFLEENKIIRKIAYSASFGIDTWQFVGTQNEKIKSLIKQFDSISVREINAVKLCNDYWEVNVDHTLDPTLLLCKNDYNNLVNKANIINNENTGIFCYILDNNKNKLEIINYIENILNKKSFYVKSVKQDKNSFIINNYDDYIIPSIEDWLNAFINADFIITDSFHGTVFSIIFNKPFISIVNIERGGSRFYSLLGELNLLDRMVNKIEDITPDLINSNINFEEVHKILNKLREDSINYLNSSLEGL